ncbi:hypothetical protein GW17_00055727 [Ensete ventricosum]|nr:hypothetical protein GW17_00055727 [Ensete ventricosum]
MTACVVLPRTIPPRSDAPCRLLVTSLLYSDPRVMNSDYDFSMCGLCQHLVGPPPFPIFGSLPWQFTFVHPLLGHTRTKHSSRTVHRLQRAELIIYFSRLRTYPFHIEEKVLMVHGTEFRLCFGMATNTPSSMYKPLHEYRILRVSNSPHLYELCVTLSVITQHLPLCMVSSFTKHPALP